MTAKIERRKTMWAEMMPDCYGGITCNRVIPRWYCAADGDMGDGDHQRTVNLAAHTFPPGTTITISEPLCPSCGDLREPKYPTPKRGALYAGKCRCGFDWDEWTLNQYS